MVKAVGRMISGGLVLAVLGTCGAYAQTSGSESFVEKFDQTLSRRWIVSNGWSNGGSFDCVFRGANVVQKDNGVAMIRSGSGPTAACGEMSSKQAYRYGTFEVRLKPAVGSGLQTGFFLYSRGTNQRPAQEINSGVLGRFAENKPVDLAIVWTEHQYALYQDGVLTKQVKAGEAAIPKDAMYVYLSLFSRKEEWIGPLDQSTLPATTTFERFSYTAWGEPCQYPESIVCRLQLTD
ncbi:MAG: family 16 glycosylhydrolase [Alsobacter sp.]